MTQSNEIEERIRNVEMELVEVKTRLNKKHEELDGLKEEVSKITDCMNHVLTLTEKVNATQDMLNSDLRDVRKESRERLDKTREELFEKLESTAIKQTKLENEVIRHSETFNSYRERQKTVQWIVGTTIAFLSVGISVALYFLGG